MDATRETQVGRFTEWFRVRPTALHFWEVLATDERLVFCFAGQSFSSALLRADMGTRTRDVLGECTIDEALVLSDRNFAVSLADLEAISLRKGTRTRKARLTIEWIVDGDRESWTLSNTKGGEEGIGVVENLSSHRAYADTSIEVETPRLAFF
ncbi:hypothetical protein BRC86_05775 [Halobacteriales archaeon QS_3_64_16]|nr:MAG: hypothetical protein BRC86_05775 [Halobacteriales archaeon QS_3_64_16]